MSSISAQLLRIRKVRHHFDVVAIIRGGGGDIGLTCYNNYDLAREIALFPIPVITGIGHSTNETVAEMVSFRNAITPTELADFLIQQFHNFAVPVQKAQESIAERSARLIRDEKIRIMHSARYFKSAAFASLVNRRNELRDKSKSLVVQSSYFFQREKKILENIERNVELMDPVNVLKRGYSITMINDKVLKSVDDAEEGSTLRTLVPDGSIVSILKSKRKTKERADHEDERSTSTYNEQ